MKGSYAVASRVALFFVCDHASCELPLLVIQDSNGRYCVKYTEIAAQHRLGIRPAYLLGNDYGVSAAQVIRSKVQSWVTSFLMNPRWNKQSVCDR